ncbi:hypothetical protein B0H14DRAFT_2786699 [Mycena olivaceomarginata]|nr:hypothetical protein B0H14DRAFT_2786699 [Mycena olivaceomarginata]
MRTLTALAFLPGLLVRVAQADIINNNCGRGPIDSSGKSGRDIINNCNGDNNGSGGDANGSPRCEPTDANGETLQDSFFESDTVFSCVYNDVGFCDYSAFSGSRLNGEDNSCPQKLERVAVASSIGSSSALSTPTLAGSSDSDSTSATQTRGSTADGGGFHSVSAPTSSQPQQGSIRIISTSQPSADFSSSRRGISAGVASGITVAVAVLLLGLVVALVLWRRGLRRRRAGLSERGAATMISRQGSVFPFTLPPQTGSLGHLGNTGPIESGDARMITRQRLEAQLFATKETLTDLENLTSPRIARSATQRFLGLVPRRNN